MSWAGLAQAWQSGCALHPGTSCTKEDLLKGQRSSWGAGTLVQPWQLAQAWATEGTPTLSSATSDLGQREKERAPGSVSLEARPLGLREDDEVLPTRKHRQEAECSRVWTLESRRLEFES